MEFLQVEKYFHFSYFHHSFCGVFGCIVTRYHGESSTLNPFGLLAWMLLWLQNSVKGLALPQDVN
ncbi:MAG: hypothetical protein J7L53_08460 [Deltaproteobacteria bacterium]|nr:hypothetical protein [Deltaproteobacteria bacterium]